MRRSVPQSCRGTKVLQHCDFRKWVWFSRVSSNDGAKTRSRLREKKSSPICGSRTDGTSDRTRCDDVLRIDSGFTDSDSIPHE